MKLKLVLHRTQPGAEIPNRTDVVVTTDATATVEDVARALAPEAAGTSATLTLVTALTAEHSTMLDPTMRIGDAPIGSGFEVAVTAATPSAYLGSEAVAVMTVIGGPESGRTIPLMRGTTTLGRTDVADVQLDDGMVSRRHARVEIGEYGIELVDLNSANGIAIDGKKLQRAWVIPGQTITLGATDVSFDLLPHTASSAPRVFERGGALMFNRSPRVEVRYPGKEHRHPSVPTEVDPRMFPWPMIMAPVLMGFGMYALTGRVTSLLIVFLAPMMMLGNVAGQRTQQSKKLKLEVATFEEQIDALERSLVAEGAVERERRRDEAPSTSTVFAEAMRLGPLLWTRRPEHWNFLGLRLGVGRATSRTTVSEANEQRGLADYVHRVNDLRARFAEVDDVPLIEMLPSSGAIGVAGQRQVVADAVRGLGVQLFGLHAPGEVVTAAIVSPSWADDLSWMKWLPHTSSQRSPFAEIALADNQTAGEVLLTALEEAILGRAQGPASARGPLAESETPMSQGKLVGERAGARGQIAHGTSVVVFVTDDAPVNRPRLAQVIERGPDVGIYTIFVGPTVESLPAACRSYIDVTQGLDRAEVGWVRAGERIAEARVEGVSLANAELFAKRLAPVVDASSVAPDSSDLPASVALLRLIGHETADETDAVIERWRQNNSITDRSGAERPRLKKARGLKAFVGQSSPDAMTLDLRTQGPHALVGGTTGSGKSEFLQAWVLGMAAEYSPDRVTFLFIDYKGGSAFAACNDLPHRVGLVTDLSPHLVRRALTSLRAELHHRERLLERRGAKDLLEMEKRQDPETPPALVLVIDEFAALVGEVPEFVDGVVDVAQRGRSLGIHLIMATQRPAGVIKDNLRANTNLRVALRMADESDSNDVVGSALAASFDPSLPGRGVVKSGPGRLVPFQSGYAGGWTRREPERARVTVADLRFGTVTEWEDPLAGAALDHYEADQGPNDQERLVRNFVTAAQAAGIPAPRRPWLDELGGAVDLLDLPLGSLDANGGLRIPLGTADVPERQLQEPVYFEPDADGHMLVYGTGGSGKSVALRSIGIAAGARPDLGHAAVYGLDFGTGALRSIEAMPHVGSIVSGDDAERVQRLFRMLRRTLDERGRKFSEVNASTITEYRAITGDVSLPRITLLIDGFGTFKQEWETTAARSSYYAVFMRILGEGRPLGVHVVASADRYGAVPTAVTANVPKRVVLRMSDEGAYAMLGAPKGVLDERSVPGRAVVDGWETQIATPGGTPNTSEQIVAAERLAALFREQGAPEVPPIGALPTELSLEALPTEIGDLPVLGITESTLGPRSFEPIGAFVIAGPPQSGKTTALRSIIRSLERWDDDVELFHIGGRRAALSGYRPWRRAATSIEEVRSLAKELKEIVADETIGSRIAIVVENITEFGDTDAERPLKELLQAINRSDHFLVADGDVTQLSSGYGLVGELKAARHGLALRPDTYDGESLFKLAFPRVQRHEFPPGRGIFVENGRSETVQVPHSPK